MMELRTTFAIQPSPDKITYNDAVMFIGSCFASAMGSQMVSGHMPVMINPAGAVFNPVSVCNTLDFIIQKKKFSLEDLHFYDGTWLSFLHYTDFSSDDPAKVLDKINKRTAEASDFLEHSKFLFVTFGTARVFRLKKSGIIVSNCHKIPSEQFEPVILSVDEIVNLWMAELSTLQQHFPGLKVVFTISPVRHWKDGAFGNQVSKSVLFVALNKILKHSSVPGYFPSYEIIMDDLRDYRFYAEDMLHPSQTAINYIWDKFAACYLDHSTLSTWKEMVKISKAFNHRVNTGNAARIKVFAEKILKHISDLASRYPSIDLSKEEEYFLKLRNS